MLTVEFQRSATAYLNWIRDQALPLWSSRGMNDETGAAVERLLPDGQVDHNADIRMLVQARQIIVFSMAAEHGWMSHEKARACVESIVAFVNQVGCAADRDGYVFSVSPSLQVADARLDLYHHAFFLLAASCRHRVFADAGAIQDAHRIMDLIDTALMARRGWLEGDYPAEYRRQNPHMHLLEAFISLARSTGEARWLALTDKVIGLFSESFYNRENGVLTEYFDESLRPAPGVTGQIAEPGHLFEWVWLLYDYQSLSGFDQQETIDALYANGIGVGLTASGLLVDEILLNGDVHNADVRLWPMTELIKACLLKAKDGDHGAQALCAKAIDALMRHFLEVPTSGAYIDRRAANGDVTVGRAPATALYHLMGAAAELDNYLSWAGSGRK